MSKKTSIRRLPERAVDDAATRNAILDEGFVCHAAYVIDGRPVVIPVLYARDGDRVLLHGSNSMGIARAVRSGSPLCVSVTHVDGLVVARSSFNSSANYRSVVIHGDGRLLDGVEKRQALDHIIEKLIPGRIADIRKSTDSEVGQTAVIEIMLDETSTKVRQGDPEDDPDDMDSDVWAGVIPYSIVTGEPIPATDLAPDIEIPDYLIDHRR